MRLFHQLCSKTAGVCLILMSSTLAYSQTLDGPAIVNHVDEVMNPFSVYARATMTIITTSGSPRTFEYESWSKNHGEKNLIRYTKPARARGQATLLLNNADDIWMYFPRTGRVRKLATHAKRQKMEGSDFSYEDLGSGDSFINDFTSKRLEDENLEGKDCYLVEMTRKKDTDIAYPRLLMWVDKENYVPLRIDYFEKEDLQNPVKRLIQQDIEVIDSLPTAKQIIMRNLQNNTSTTVQLLEVSYSRPAPDEFFTERGLKK